MNHNLKKNKKFVRQLIEFKPHFTRLFIRWIVISSLLIGIVATLDAVQKSKEKTWYSEFINFELPLLENIGNLGIIAGLITFVSDIPNQQKKSRNKKTSPAINSVEHHSGSQEPIQALQQLEQRNSSEPMDAYLNRIKLQGANLVNANLEKKFLKYSDFRDANLSSAALNDANLNLSNLSGANLSGADLSGADLYSSKLSAAKLSDANLNGANLIGADLSGANLIGVKNATVEQIKSAKNWEKAKYEEVLRNKLGL